MKKKQRKVSLLLELLAVLLGAMMALALIITLYSSNVIRKSINEKALEGLEYVCTSLSGAMDQIDGNFYVNDHGTLSKGTKDLGYDEAYLDPFVEGSDIALTIFCGDTRALTTITDDAGNRIIGTPCTDEVKKVVLEQGQVYTTTNVKINGKAYYAVYMPYKDNQGNIAGMYFAGEPSEDTLKAINLKMSRLVFVSVFLFILIIGIEAFFISKIVKAIKAVTNAVKQVAEGELNVDVPAFALKRGDEIGDMARAMKNTIEQLRSTIGTINEITATLVKTGTELDESAAQTSDTADEISHAVEDISKGAVAQAEDIEDATSAVAEMGEGFANIIESVSVLNNSADEMLDADEASEAIIADLAESNETTSRAISEVAIRVDATDKSVQNIQEAVSLISSIADQTNLLSLNASIEAARAGEAGRGFAVVASEISKLAEESQNSANRISDIITQLSLDSQATVAEMTEMAKAAEIQREKLVQTREKFQEVTNGIKITIEQADRIRHESDGCNASKVKVVDIISNLSAVSEENAASTEETTASMQELNATINLVAQSAKDLQDIAVELEKNVSFFKV